MWCVFVLRRVLPQVLLTVLVVLSSQSFSNAYYYSMAVAGMCLCHMLNVLKAIDMYSSKPDRAAAMTTGFVAAAPLAATVAVASSSKH
jgi:hypothetical protein